jgi:hypothetical protein
MIVDPSIQSEHVAEFIHSGLYIQPGSLMCVKRLKSHANPASISHRDAVWSLVSRCPRKLHELLPLDDMTLGLAYPKLNAHSCSPAASISQECDRSGAHTACH